MLNKENIHQILLNPSGISDKNTSDLEALSKEHPYASTLSLLYLKGLKITSNLHYEKQLPKTSILAPNREILYQLIIQEELQQSIKEEIESADLENTIISEPEKKENVPSTEVKEKNEEQEKAIIAVDKLEETILSEITSYNIEETSNKAKASKKEKRKPPNKQSFNSWLNPNKRQDTPSIIEDFISKNPSITPNKTDMYSAPNISKMSAIKDEGFVTETLARIYMKQGHFDKAIKTYQKLSLKIPEKKAFFASQIEVIQELKKQEE